MGRTAPIVFSHSTALQILRRLPPELLAQRSRLRQWPQHPVSRAQLDAAVARVETLFPAPFGSGSRPVPGRPGAASSAAGSASGTAPGSAPGSAPGTVPGAIPLRRPVHFITGCATQNRRRSASICHMTSQTVDGRYAIKLDEGIFVCCPELAFIQVAAHLGNVETLELGFELCGTYRTARTEHPAAHNVPPLTSTKKLQEFMDAASRQPGIGTARASLDKICDNSASARETALAILLELPLHKGGYALGTPIMNSIVNSTHTTQQIYRADFMKCDIAWPNQKVDIEYQSRYAHEGETARIRDSRRSNALGELGWTVITVTNEELNSLTACNAIASRIRKALKLKKRALPEGYEKRQSTLRWELGLP